MDVDERTAALARRLLRVEVERLDGEAAALAHESETRRLPALQAAKAAREAFEALLPVEVTVARADLERLLGQQTPQMRADEGLRAAIRRLEHAVDGEG